VLSVLSATMYCPCFLSPPPHDEYSINGLVDCIELWLMNLPLYHNPRLTLEVRHYKYEITIKRSVVISLLRTIRHCFSFYHLHIRRYTNLHFPSHKPSVHLNCIGPHLGPLRENNSNSPATFLFSAGVVRPI
jgi:hypothetical protein